ncbi:hypothetical protein WM16_09045 [Burkholderia ubonensis]|uniref:Uncharacterized protein n=1 Tax=Burkholderia ubonensis TaxID=101571 RepID=A0A108CQI3_9BURK|nr:hypothetical protein [Burkholderia ubonensis]KWK79088.1 hypothetical protein WM16_09045 [Burkholderia ubonensis]
MNFADWIDTGATPPQRLSGDTDAAVAYLTDALGHVVYRRWTLAAVKQHYPGALQETENKARLARQPQEPG